MSKTQQHFKTYGIPMIAYINDDRRTVVVKPEYDSFRLSDGAWLELYGLLGKATCHPEDQFNIQEGIRIATTRLLNAIEANWGNQLLNEANKYKRFCAFIDRRKPTRKVEGDC